MNWKTNKDLNNARTLFAMTFAIAKEYGLEWEFINSYKRKEGNGILDSIHFACAEWDLGIF